MIIAFDFIPGMMLGIEFPNDPDVSCVIDLLIFRIIFVKPDLVE